MQTVRWSFNPAPAATVATALLLPLLLSLGFWQLDRADQKQAVFDDHLARVSAAPLDLNAVLPTGTAPDEYVWRRATLRGSYADTAVFLLDNQVRNGQPGYFVLAPFETGGGASLIVNRGWIAAGAYRDEVPALEQPAGTYSLTGTITAYPSPPGIRLDGDEASVEQMAPGIYRVQVISRQLVEQVLGRDQYPYVLQLGPEAPTGFLRDWPQPGSGRERHLGYAFQWFSLAAALAIIYIAVNLKRRPAE